jgi:hypothetical protein
MGWVQRTIVSHADRGICEIFCAYPTLGCIVIAPETSGQLYENFMLFAPRLQKE